MDFWQAFQNGTAGRGQGLLLGLGAAAAGLVLSLGLLRPLIRILLAREEARDREHRIRRRVTTFLLASVALGFFIYFHATLVPAIRRSVLRFQLSELALIAVAGYGAAELLLVLFSVCLPQARGRAPLAPILQDLARAGLAVGLFLLGIHQAFPAADIGALITTSAILSIVLGLALQESLSNVFSGIMLTIDRPFKPGDWIEVEGREGKVLDSNWRSTRILTREDDVIYVPNSTLAKGAVTNFSAPDPIKLVLREVGIEYGAPPNRVRSVLIAMMRSVDGVLTEPPPDVFLKDYGDSAVVHQLRFWIQDYDRRTRIESEVMRGVWYALRREGISIPFPIRDVYLRREKASNKPEEILALLRKVDILSPLKEEELLMLAGELGHQLFARGEAVCRQGDPGSSFYLIRSGSISVSVKGPDGADTEVAKLGPGQYFGEMSLLTGDSRSSTCRALEDAELLCLDRETFAVLLKDNPPVAQAMSDILAARASATQEKLNERETLVRKRDGEHEKRADTILQRIRGIFGFKRQP